MSINNDTAAKQIIGAEILSGTLNELHARQSGKKISNPLDPASKDVIGGEIISSTINSVNSMKAGMANMGHSGGIINNKT